VTSADSFATQLMALATPLFHAGRDRRHA